MTIPAERLLDHIPARRIVWCTWDAIERPAPRTRTDLGDYTRESDGTTNNGFTWPDDESGLPGIRAATAAGKDVYLMLPGGWRDYYTYSADEDPQRRAWENLAETSQVFLDVKQDSPDAYGRRWTVVHLDATLTEDEYTQAVALITQATR